MDEGDITEEEQDVVIEVPLEEYYFIILPFYENRD